MCGSPFLATAKALFDRVHTHHKEDDVESQREETPTVLAEFHNNGYSKRFVGVFMDKHRQIPEKPIAPEGIHGKVET